MARFPGSIYSLRFWSHTANTVKTIWKVHRTSMPRAWPAFKSKGTWARGSKEWKWLHGDVTFQKYWRQYADHSWTDLVHKGVDVFFSRQGQIDSPGSQEGPQTLCNDVNQGPQAVQVASCKHGKGQSWVHLITKHKTLKYTIKKKQHKALMWVCMVLGPTVAWLTLNTKKNSTTVLH